MHTFSNDVSRCNEHRAATPQESRIKPGRYRNFISESIGSKLIQKDVRATGDKIGLSKFLL
ncbi:hypothetical protein NC652_004258 [Populus alba x Populus x berolinensis]|uniref:Uncharacterized protein n=1 Tax=Populus alba x Populus x berolinensis TaxID=444605 RepID=A0AAD6WJI8_9ROSI|nr:hypothetical protein NC652_004258 [Populus alba x Populus x berolinensis]KAJ7014900.1 hypothetical protein NC653_004257 [Populus alba x Populus x berolinensis]